MESKLGHGMIMNLENNHSEGHKEYLLWRAKDYKSEQEIMLGSTKNTALPGREYCEQCDPRFRVLQRFYNKKSKDKKSNDKMSNDKRSK